MRVRSGLRFASVLFAVVSVSFGATKPLQLTDILAWKRIQSPELSRNGKWFAYKVVPNDGDSEVVVRNLQTGDEKRFPIGELPRAEGFGPAPPAGNDVAFSADGQWCGFLVYPTGKERKQLTKTRKPAQSKFELLELGSGTKTDFDAVRRFAFSGDRSTMVAMLRYAPAAAAPAGPPVTMTGAKPEEKPQGADLILRDLATTNELNFGNVSEFSFTKKGDRLAWLVDAQDKAGNGIQVMTLATGAVTPLDSAKAVYKGLNWTDKGDAMATVRGVDDKGWEDKLYSVVAFRWNGDRPEKFLYDPFKDSSFPKDMTISSSRNAMWMADLSAVTFGIHEIKAKPKKDGKDKDDDTPATKPDLAIWHWKDDRLQPMQQVQENADKNFNFVGVYAVADKKFIRLADSTMRQVALLPDYRYAVGTDVREYELTGNLDGKRYSDVYRVDPRTGERTLALRKARWYRSPSPDGRKFLFYNDGAFLAYDMESGKQTNLTKSLPASFIDTEDDHNVEKPPARELGWSKDGKFVLLSDSWDIWKVPAEGGAGVNLTGNGKKDKIRYRQVFRLNPDDKGFDLDKPLYVSVYGEWTKKGGIGILMPGKEGIQMAQWGDASYPQLIKAKDADVYLYSKESVTDYPNFYAADAMLHDGKRVTDADPQQKDFAWTAGSRLVEYTGTRGVKLQGALYLPANYQPGKKYPTIVYIYEKLSQATNAYPQPGFNGFSVGAYTSNGYAVLTPDIDYKVNDPGISAVHCILAALKAAEATGVVDSEHVGLHGHSWGGYQTAFTITQTKAFRAAIAGAPLTDMVSMYSSIYWNTGTANQPIFESSQGRFTTGYTDNPEAYLRNSPVYQAKKVETPLLILHNDKDGAVDHTQGIEYFNTLRRLGKPVVMLEYKGENHGLVKPENKKDYTVRVKEFFDYYLMDKPAPKWMTDGLPQTKKYSPNK